MTYSQRTDRQRPEQQLHANAYLKMKSEVLTAVNINTGFMSKVANMNNFSHERNRSVSIRLVLHSQEYSTVQTIVHFSYQKWKGKYSEDVPVQGMKVHEDVEVQIHTILAVIMNSHAWTNFPRQMSPEYMEPRADLDALSSFLSPLRNRNTIPWLSSPYVARSLDSTRHSARSRKSIKALRLKHTTQFRSLQAKFIAFFYHHTDGNGCTCSYQHTILYILRVWFSQTTKNRQPRSMIIA